MLTLQSDLKPKGGPREPARLMFSPDGTALLASTGNRVQVWPRWLDGPPRPAVETESMLERVALSSDGARAYLYRSGNSYTDVLDVATGEIGPSGLPEEDPSWAWFGPDGRGFFLVCREQGTLARYECDPGGALREAWAIERWAGAGPRRKAVGSHYRFGAVGGPDGPFVALEYKFGGSEPFEGLTVRSAADGAVQFHQPLKSDVADTLLNEAGLTLSLHPSGRYFAYPSGPVVRFRPLAAGVKVRTRLARPKPPPKKARAKPAAKPPAKPKPEPHVCAVAFHPNGGLLATAGDDEVVRIFDTTSWKEVQSFKWKVGKLKAVCFSADGTRGAVWSSRGTIVVWDVDV